MGQTGKCLPDQMYDSLQEQPEQMENNSATGAENGKTAYCVDGSILYCTAGSASSQLHVEDHGLSITGCFAAHDGDREPGKNILPFGNCSLKNHHPCSPAPVGRWLLPDEYAVIGSRYQGKIAQFQKAQEIAKQTADALAPLHAAAYLLQCQDMPRLEPELRNEIFRISRALRYGKERCRILSARLFTDMEEIQYFHRKMLDCMRRAADALSIMQNLAEGPGLALQMLQNDYAKVNEALRQQPPDSDAQKNLEELKKRYESAMKPKINASREFSQLCLREHEAILAPIRKSLEQSMSKMERLINEADAYSEPAAPDQGCQITVESIIPCQTGGMIYV